VNTDSLERAGFAKTNYRGGGKEEGFPPQENKESRGTTNYVC